MRKSELSVGKNSNKNSNRALRKSGENPDGSFRLPK